MCTSAASVGVREAAAAGGKLADRGNRRIEDAVNLAVVLDLHRQVDQRSRRHRNPNGVPVELAVELRDHEADRLGGAGRGRDQVDRRRPRAAQVLVRQVLKPLVGGVGVDRRHHP